MAAHPATPWTGGGGGGGGGHLPWAQPPGPAVAHHHTGGGGGPAAAMRDRSNEGLDTVDLFATGPHCGCSTLAISGYMLIVFCRRARPHSTPSPRR